MLVLAFIAGFLTGAITLVLWAALDVASKADDKEGRL